MHNYACTLSSAANIEARYITMMSESVVDFRNLGLQHLTLLTCNILYSCYRPMCLFSHTYQCVFYHFEKLYVIFLFVLCFVKL